MKNKTMYLNVTKYWCKNQIYTYLHMGILYLLGCFRVITREKSLDFFGLNIKKSCLSGSHDSIELKTKSVSNLVR